MKMLRNKISLLTKMRWMVFLLGNLKIPMIGYVSPTLLQLDDDKAVVKIRLKRRTKNHLKSMYFGSLAIGADLVGGVHAFYYAKKLNTKISFAFKDVKAEFIKRAETDVLFATNEGTSIKAAMDRAVLENTRINQPVKVKAYNIYGEKVADFILTASFKPIV